MRRCTLCSGETTKGHNVFLTRLVRLASLCNTLLDICMFIFYFSTDVSGGCRIEETVFGRRGQRRIYSWGTQDTGRGLRGQARSQRGRAGVGSPKPPTLQSGRTRNVETLERNNNNSSDQKAKGPKRTAFPNGNLPATYLNEGAPCASRPGRPKTTPSHLESAPPSVTRVFCVRSHGAVTGNVTGNERAVLRRHVRAIVRLV